ncbi:MAG: hypothetical protein LBP53_01995 [Candidatus Peribacteria bacterium]|nr:hypothetical protein [Candidatus Peribacteria bacterium]
MITLFDQLGTYTSQLTTAQATIDALQTRYDTTQLTAHQQLQEADLNIMTLQQLFSQTEQRLQTFIITSQSLPHPTPFS